MLACVRPADAMAAYEQSLLRTPKRTPSLARLARSAVKAGRTAAARQAYQELAGMAGADPRSAVVQEARKVLGSN